MYQILSKSSSSLNGIINLPGDKSISQRCLILGSLSIGTTKIKGMSFSEDVNNLINNLKLLGIQIIKEKEIIKIIGVGIGGLRKPKKNLYMGNSGTATRLMMGTLCNQNFKVNIVGDKSLNNRDMNKLIEPLKEMGAEIKSKNNKLPIVITGNKESIPISYNQIIPSAQIKSSILLASLGSPGITTIVENIPTRNHTEILLKNFGANINIKKSGKKNIIKIIGQKELTAKNIIIGGDPSAAAIVGAGALITRKSLIKIKNININKTRTAFFNILKKMGANILISNKRKVSNEDIADITFKSSNLKGINLNKTDVANMIDEIPIFSILASFAKGSSSFKGGNELKNKESDRIKSIYEGLTACKIKVKKNYDGLKITGSKNNPIGAKVKTYYDHRIAMAFIIMGLNCKEGIEIDDERCLKTSFPNFIPLIKSLGANISKKN